MDTEKLAALLHVVDSGSIQGAARALGVTRSSLRRCLDGLEAEVGAPLLHRDAHGVRLTPSGAVLVEQGRSLLESARALLTEARSAAGEATGTIRVIEPVGMPVQIQTAAVLAMRARLPHQRLVMRHVEDPAMHLHEPFELMLHEGPPPDRSTWFSRVILRAPLRVIASQRYLAAQGRPADAGELGRHAVLGWKRPGQRADEWPLLRGGSVPVKPWFISTDPTLLWAVAGGGGGLLLAVRSPAAGELDTEPMEEVLEEEIGAEFVFRVSSPNPIRADSRTRHTLQQILEQLDGLPED